MGSEAEILGYMIKSGDLKRFSKEQEEKFREIGGMVDRGEITLNQSYKLAKKNGFKGVNGSYSNSTGDYEQAMNEWESENWGDSSQNGGFKDWANTAKSAGWINTGLNVLNSLFGTGSQGQQEQQPQVVVVKDEDKGLSTGAIIGISLGGVAILGTIIFLATRNRD